MAHSGKASWSYPSRPLAIGFPNWSPPPFVREGHESHCSHSNWITFVEWMKKSDCVAYMANTPDPLMPADDGIPRIAEIRPS